VAHFCEILKCAGVDEAVDPQTMVVPFGGTNFVALDGDDFKNLRIVSHHKSIEIKELESSSATISQFLLKRNELHNQLAQPDADSQERDSLSPDTFFGGMRYFLVRGKALVGVRENFFSGPRGVR